MPFLEREGEWDGKITKSKDTFVTAIGAGTTYPDYKPAPFIVSSEVDGVDMVTVVTEGIFSYCGVKLKIDTDRHLGPERSLVRAQGEPVGHVTTAEYGSQMLSIGGVHHLTGGTKSEGRVTCETLLDLCNGKEVALTIDEGAINRCRCRKISRREWPAGRTHARGLRLGHHRHVCQTMVRQSGRSRSCGRSHHRRALRTPSRQNAGRSRNRYRHRTAVAPLPAAIFRSRNRERVGAAQIFPIRCDTQTIQAQDCVAAVCGC